MKKILLIEDNEECRKMLTCIIGCLSYDMIQADFLDGTCRATSEHPDLILISLDFPRMWGLDVTTSLKSNPKPLIFLFWFILRGIRKTLQKQHLTQVPRKF